MRPSDRAVRRRALTATDAVGGVAALVRLSALGGSAILPLLGVASAAGEVPVQSLVLAAAIGVAFHVFAYVLNDVIDLRIDATDPRRMGSPLVNGFVSPAAALTLAILMLAVAASAAAQASVLALAAVAAAAVGLAAYDLLGKRTSLPPLADGVQGLGWGALVLAGSWLAGGPTPLSFALAGYIALFIVMANGVHGAIRDLPNDERHGVRTTASMLGARATRDGARVVPRRVTGYAWMLQVALLAVAGVAVLAADGSILAVVPSATAVLLLGAATRARTDADLLAAGMLHLIVALTVPIALVAGSALPPVTALLVATYVLPLLTHGWLRGAMAWGRRSAVHAIRFAADLARLTRPHNALAAGVAVIIGAHLGGRSDLVAEPVFRAALVASLVVAAANVANDRADVVEDRINRPTRPIAAGLVSPRAGTRVALALAAAAGLLATTLGPVPAAAAFALMAVAFAYSSHLKGTFLLGNVVVAALSASTIVFGALVLARATPAVVLGAAFVFVSVASSELLKCTADRDGDRVAGRTTIATRLPMHACLRLHAALVVVLVALVLAPSLAGVAPTTFLAASVVGVVAPQLLILARLRTARQTDSVRRVLPLAKVAWFTGLASLAFLV